MKFSTKLIPSCCGCLGPAKQPKSTQVPGTFVCSPTSCCWFQFSWHEMVYSNSSSKWCPKPSPSRRRIVAGREGVSDATEWTDKKLDLDKAEVTEGNEMEHLRSHN